MDVEQLKLMKEISFNLGLLIIIVLYLILDFIKSIKRMKYEYIEDEEETKD